jgi:DNA helicase-2/ATP-dependent DNA helicase PcrA
MIRPPYLTTLPLAVLSYLRILHALSNKSPGDTALPNHRVLKTIGNLKMKSNSIDYLADLNREQRRAVEHSVTSKFADDQRPLLVIAGAGSGKTKTLAHRVAHLIVHGVDPQRILLLTFSRRASVEMKARVERITAAALEIGKVDLPWSGTFHSIGARLLRENARRIGLNPSFSIHDRSDAADMMNLVRHDLEQSTKKSRFPTKDTCLSIYSLAVNSETPIKRILAESFPWCIEWEKELRKLFRRYVEAKQAQNVLDYDDLLLAWAEMMEVEELAAEVGERFEHVLVDEYQDTNRLQSRILSKLKPAGQGLMVVGDDAQSIYSFRAATVRNILDFPDQFEPQARIVTLEQNYRSTQPILDVCNAVIGLAKERFTKNLRSDRRSKQKPFLTTVTDETAQARHVAQEILDAREAGTPLKSQAVLFRAAHHSDQLEIELARRNIPFVKFGGLKFLEAAHVKDVMSVLRWCENPRDRVAGFRVLQLLPGIGPSTAERILDVVETQTDGSDALSKITVPKATAEDWPAFARLVARLRRGKKGWPAEFHLVGTWYGPHLLRIYEDGQMRAADVAQLAQIAAGFASREQFLTEVTLDPPNATSGRSKAALLDEDYLVLSTIHSAKGQEWKIVRVLNVVDGCIPSDRATGTPEEIEEERRLLYVAMTRAKDELNLVVPHRFFTYRQAKFDDGHVYASVSRFIPKSIERFFERRHWSEPGAVAKAATRQSAVRFESGRASNGSGDEPRKSAFSSVTGERSRGQSHAMPA